MGVVLRRFKRGFEFWGRSGPSDPGSGWWGSLLWLLVGSDRLRVAAILNWAGLAWLRLRASRGLFYGFLADIRCSQRETDSGGVF